MPDADPGDGEADVGSGHGGAWAEKRSEELKREAAAPWGEKAMAAIRAGDWAQALRCFEEGLKIDPEDCVFWNDRGNVLRELGRPDEALRSYEKCLEVNRWYSDAWLHMAQVQNGLGREADELRCIQMFVLLDFSPAVKRRGRFQARLRDKGIPELDLKEQGLFLPFMQDFFAKMAFLGADPQSPKSWVRFTENFESMGRPDVAVLCLERALELDPRSAEAWYQLGHMRLKGGSLEESLRCFCKVLQADEGHSLGWWSKALVEERLGRPAEQAESLRRFLASEPKGYEDTVRKARELLGRLEA